MTGPTPGSCSWCGGSMDPVPPERCLPYCSAECRRERDGQACDHGHATAKEYLPCWQRATWGDALVILPEQLAVETGIPMKVDPTPEAN